MSEESIARLIWLEAAISDLGSKVSGIEQLDPKLISELKHAEELVQNVKSIAEKAEVDSSIALSLMKELRNDMKDLQLTTDKNTRKILGVESVVNGISGSINEIERDILAATRQRKRIIATEPTLPLGFKSCSVEATLRETYQFECWIGTHAYLFVGSQEIKIDAINNAYTARFGYVENRTPHPPKITFDWKNKVNPITVKPMPMTSPGSTTFLSNELDGDIHVACFGHPQNKSGWVLATGWDAEEGKFTKLIRRGGHQWSCKGTFSRACAYQGVSPIMTVDIPPAMLLWSIAQAYHLSQIDETLKKQEKKMEGPSVSGVLSTLVAQSAYINN